MIDTKELHKLEEKLIGAGIEVFLVHNAANELDAAREAYTNSCTERDNLTLRVEQLEAQLSEARLSATQWQDEAALRLKNHEDCQQQLTEAQSLIERHEDALDAVWDDAHNWEFTQKYDYGTGVRTFGINTRARFDQWVIRNGFDDPLAAIEAAKLTESKEEA